MRVSYVFPFYNNPRDYFGKGSVGLDDGAGNDWFGMPVKMGISDRW